MARLVAGHVEEDGAAALAAAAAEEAAAAAGAVGEEHTHADVDDGRCEEARQQEVLAPVTARVAVVGCISCRDDTSNGPQA